MDLSFIVIIVQLIFLEGILSIDNAAVLGAMVTPLSDHESVPWPKWLSNFGHKIDKILGPQRTAALRVGLIGAYLGRGIMLVLASLIVSNPWLKLIGAAYLIRLALDDLSSQEDINTNEDVKSIKPKSFWLTVLTVELMDLAFSLDNVVAAISLSDKLWVVMLGVALGILLMRYAAGIFSTIIEKEPVLKKAAYILVLNIGIEIILEELTRIEIGDWMRFGISLCTIVISLAYAHIPILHNLRPFLEWISRGFGLINNIVSWIFAPISALIKLIRNAFRNNHLKSRTQKGSTTHNINQS